MSPVDALILGVVQGVTEFLPISSTGHLILVREVLELESGIALAVDAILHLASALAVVWYFRTDLLEVMRAGLQLLRNPRAPHPQRSLLFALCLGTIPAVVAGLLLESHIETVFRNVTLVAWVLIAGSLLFLVAEWALGRYTRTSSVTPLRGIGIGLFQALALLPGMSRSGATIAGGMLMGLSRESAARFAFLLSLPIIIGAGGMKLRELLVGGDLVSEWSMIALAAGAAFFAGLASIHFLLTFLKRHTLFPFVIYRIALAMILLALF